MTSPSDEVVQAGAEALHAVYCGKPWSGECYGPSRQQVEDARTVLDAALPIERELWRREPCRVIENLLGVIRRTREADLFAEFDRYIEDAEVSLGRYRAKEAP